MNTFIPYHEQVANYFQSRSSHWNDLYSSRSVYAESIRARQAAVLSWIDGLNLAPGSAVLEIGCGAGWLAIALVERGLCVQAIDASPAMVQQAQRNAAQAGCADRLAVAVGDVYALTFADSTFDLVLAIGVLPWLAHAEHAIQEMARVSRPSGYLLLTAANYMGLPALLDPQLTPALTPLRRHVRATLELVGVRVGLPEQLPKLVYHRRRDLEAALQCAGLDMLDEQTVGFGPFTLGCRTILPNRLGLWLHRRLQRLAERNLPIVRSLGMSYHVLARKGRSPTQLPPMQDKTHEQARSSCRATAP